LLYFSAADSDSIEALPIGLGGAAAAVVVLGAGVFVLHKKGKLGRRAVVASSAQSSGAVVVEMQPPRSRPVHQAGNFHTNELDNWGRQAGPHESYF
jgi:hypothetical protein